MGSTEEPRGSDALSSPVLQPARRCPTPPQVRANNAQAALLLRSSGAVLGLVEAGDTGEQWRRSDILAGQELCSARRSTTHPGTTA